ncbi:hypothetical protein Sgou_03550 [Streptomyces gougerotii]|uniref:Uncharacterized protein n=2 Tax=Streptomyces diastaticus group TaxID=2849069 RepID=A0A8H9LNW9_9ACTN|nr:hypothetical protein Srut_26140 [Streptomyces rutgersensis]GFH71356.1 hypothetical protein Sdia_21240 [Streptomyces diastaticus subsp. diastaticus]GFH75685.1 hypothetical protein Sgou_03550 [Streptomyces gougerotii]GGU11865.1 hypothetical protein GCM10015534_12800 [Streptomyces diastaticus subsp. diastaticus]GGU59330.1 hypothetical protein GCM10010227_10860 [Streptomyces gougerotii]
MPIGPGRRAGFRRCQEPATGRHGNGLQDLSTTKITVPVGIGAPDGHVEVTIGSSCRNFSQALSDSFQDCYVPADPKAAKERQARLPSALAGSGPCLKEYTCDVA